MLLLLRFTTSALVPLLTMTSRIKWDMRLAIACKQPRPLRQNPTRRVGDVFFHVGSHGKIGVESSHVCNCQKDTFSHFYLRPPRLRFSLRSGKSELSSLRSSSRKRLLPDPSSAVTGRSGRDEIRAANETACDAAWTEVASVDGRSNFFYSRMRRVRLDKHVSKAR